MSTVVPFPRRDTTPLLTKPQLASALGRSERWVELRQRDGLPVASVDRSGRNRYRLGDVEAWLQVPRESMRPVGERLAVLERQVAELRAIIEQGRKT